MPTNETDTLAGITLHVLSAFTDGTEGGNPAGVVLDADGLSEPRMQAIATRAGLSETAFVSASATGGVRLDFFTPARRIADCGHATVAAFALLHETGRIGPGETSKEVVDGLRAVTVMPGGAVFMEQPPLRYRALAVGSGAGVGDVLTALDLAPQQLDPRVGPVVADAGGPFAMLALGTERDLSGIRADQPALLRISEALDLIGFYAFVIDPGRERAATARMFAPRFGILEESATGMAAGALGAVLNDLGGRPGPTFLIEQGRHMTPPSPSLLEVRIAVTRGCTTGITTGGRATLRSACCVSTAPA